MNDKKINKIAVPKTLPDCQKWRKMSHINTGQFWIHIENILGQYIWRPRPHSLLLVDKIQDLPEYLDSSLHLAYRHPALPSHFGGIMRPWAPPTDPHILVLEIKQSHYPTSAGRPACQDCSIYCRLLC